MALPVLVGVGVGAGIAALFMGGDKATFYAKLNQDIQNSVYQDFTAKCSAVCENFASETYVIVIDSKVPGGIRFNQKCNVVADCSLSNTAEAVASTVAQASAEQSAFIQNSFLSLGGTTLNNNIDISQKLRNQLTQVLSASCNVTSRNIARNTVLFVRNTETDAVEFTQSGEASMNCALNNTGKVAIFNDVAATSKQTATILSWAGGMALIIGIVVIIAVLGFVIVTVFKGGKKTPSSEEEGTTGKT